MQKYASIFPLLAVFTASGCQSPAPAPALPPGAHVTVARIDTLPPLPDSIATTGETPAADEEKATGGASGPASDQAPAGMGFVDLAVLDTTMRFDIRYATTNNFTHSIIYDCPRCLLRAEAARALMTAQRLLRPKGLRLKLFDCYRPRPYQQRLWDKVPDPNYVTPPAKGSMHARGAAVDITIVDRNGRELDMGTPFDHFGPKAHYDCQNLPARVIANRRLLRETLEAVGFGGIRTEWWHFSYREKQYPLSDYVWKCK